MKKTIILFATLLTFSVAAQKEKFIKIDSLIQSKVEDNHPGIAVGIIQNGKIIYEKYRGLSNLQHQVKFDKKTRSNIASTAKQFTALMILQLSLEEKLSLEDDIRKYLPALYPKVKEQIKVRHLLNHTSGIRDYVELLDMDGRVWWQRFKLSNKDVIKLLGNQIDLGFNPGTKYAYSNSNYIVLTKIIEKVTGKTFNEYSKTFFENLGMNETSFVERYMKVIPNRANPYSDWGKGEWWEVPTVTKTNGEGFLFTTLKDQLIFEIAVQNANYNNNVLLIKSQQAIPNSEIKRYGFGLELLDKLGRKAVHHSGGTYGFHSQMFRFPEEKFTIFIMSNNGSISSNFIAKDIARILLHKKKTKYAKPFYEKNNSTEDISITGKYTFPNENAMVEVFKKDDEIFWREKNFTIKMIEEDQNRYSFANDPQLKVVFYKDKTVEFYPSGKIKAYKKSNELPITQAQLNGLVGSYTNNELNVSFEIKRNKENQLEFKLSTDKGSSNIKIYNNKYLLANNYFLKVLRDKFDRVYQIQLNYGRALNMSFKKKTNLIFQPKIKTENGSINVTTIGSKSGKSSQILLTANYPNGNEIWYKQFGGKNYDKASSIISTDDGYLIIGSTSSYGNGNYDMFVVKTDKKGKKQWQNTYGNFYNEYGYNAEKTKDGFLIKGTKQHCENNTDINRKCTTNVWFVSIDKKGKKLTEQILEEIKD